MLSKSPPPGSTYSRCQPPPHRLHKGGREGKMLVCLIQATVKHTVEAAYQLSNLGTPSWCTRDQHAAPSCHMVIHRAPNGDLHLKKEKPKRRTAFKRKKENPVQPTTGERQQGSRGANTDDGLQGTGSLTTQSIRKSNIPSHLKTLTTQSISI